MNARAGRPHPARAMATPSPPVEANAGALRRVAREASSRGSRPSGHEFFMQERGRGRPGPKHTPARARVAAAADAGVPAAPPPGAASAQGRAKDPSLDAVERKAAEPPVLAGP